MKACDNVGLPVCYDVTESPSPTDQYGAPRLPVNVSCWGRLFSPDEVRRKRISKALMQKLAERMGCRSGKNYFTRLRRQRSTQTFTDRETNGDRYDVTRVPIGDWFDCCGLIYFLSISQSRTAEFCRVKQLFDGMFGATVPIVDFLEPHGF